MEPEGLRRCIATVVNDDDLTVESIATDRHLMIGSIMKQDFPEVPYILPWT